MLAINHCQYSKLIISKPLKISTSYEMNAARQQIAQFSQDRNVTRNVGVLFPLLGRTQSSKLPLNPQPEKGSKPLHSCTDSLLHSTR